MQKVGRELDALVAEHAMGYLWWNKGGRSFLMSADSANWAPALGLEQGRAEASNLEPMYSVPHYSESIAAAWEVAERFTDVLVEKAGGNYRVIISAAFEGNATTLPLAICLAALAALAALETSA